MADADTQTEERVASRIHPHKGTQTEESTDMTPEQTREDGLGEIKRDIRAIQVQLESLVSGKGPRAKERTTNKLGRNGPNNVPPIEALERVEEQDAEAGTSDPTTDRPWNVVTRRGSQSERRQDRTQQLQQPPALKGSSEEVHTKTDTGKASKHKPTKVMVEVKGASYSAVLGKLKRGLGSGAEAEEITSARRSLAGNVVLELKKGASGENIIKKIGSIMEGSKAVVTRGSRMAAEIKFLEEDTSEEEIKEAVERETGGKGKINVLWIRNYGGDLRIALVEGPRNEISRLIGKGRLRIGWSNCRVGAKPNKPEQCHKCRGFGHKAAQCSGKDRTEECRRCGAMGHKAKGCDVTPKCGPCEDAGERAEHVTGGEGCVAYKEALRLARPSKGNQIETVDPA